MDSSGAVDNPVEYHPITRYDENQGFFNITYT